MVVPLPPHYQLGLFYNDATAVAKHRNQWRWCCLWTKLLCNWPFGFRRLVLKKLYSMLAAVLLLLLLLLLLFVSR